MFAHLEAVWRYTLSLPHVLPWLRGVVGHVLAADPSLELGLAMVLLQRALMRVNSSRIWSNVGLQ
jgi:hypothetical protein